jgi:beta-phosphoglucomutase
MPQSCVIFDFDGVIADTERLHLAAYNQNLAAHAALIGGPLEITAEQYFSRYIVYGDLEATFHMLRDAGRPHDAALVQRIADAKHQLFEHNLKSFADPLPGVRETLAFLEARRVPRAICSGARRSEITQLLHAFELQHHFDVLIAIEDVRLGKPDPEGYLRAFDQLNMEYDAELDKDKSLVIEDSAGGIAAGRAAGLRVLGVATSLPLAEVRRHATFAIESLAQLDHGELARWLDLK